MNIEIKHFWQKLQVYIDFSIWYCYKPRLKMLYSHSIAVKAQCNCGRLAALCAQRQKKTTNKNNSLVSKDFYSIFCSQVWIVHNQQPQLTGLLYKRHLFAQAWPRHTVCWWWPKHDLTDWYTAHAIFFFLCPDQVYHQVLLWHFTNVFIKHDNSLWSSKVCSLISPRSTLSFGST